MREYGHILGLGVVMLVLLTTCSAYNYGTAFERDIEVARLFQTVSGSGERTSDHYMVTDSDGNTYTVDDSLLRWQFRSTDLWATLEEGERYRIRAYGWRVGFLSWYPNIFAVDPLP